MAKAHQIRNQKKKHALQLFLSLICNLANGSKPGKPRGYRQKKRNQIKVRKIWEKSQLRGKTNP